MTIFSMTGYAAVSCNIPDEAGTPSATNLNLELRGVNSRFLDLNFRMPDELRALEPKLKELLTKSIHRGKVECRINLISQNATQGSQINVETLQQLIALQNQLIALAGNTQILSAAEILRWPGVINETRIPPDILHQTILSSAQSCVEEFLNTRRSEGEKLSKVLLHALDAMSVIVLQLARVTPQLVEAQKHKLTERLNEALGLAGNSTILSKEEIADRIRQEVTLYAIRIDIEEELNRLKAHIEETRQIVAKGGAVGKRLDFMAQELNREANTLGAKAASKELADASMSLKLLIEQIREQVQNLE